METTRDLLLIAAERQVGSRGYAGFSFADLADAVGIRKPSVHHYFPTKEDLAIALIEKKTQLFKIWTADLALSHRDALSQLNAYVSGHLEQLRENITCVCAMLASDQDALPARVQAAAAAFFVSNLGWLQSMIVAGQREGTLKRELDAADEAKAFFAALLGAMLSARALSRLDVFEAIAGTCLQRLQSERKLRRRNHRSPARGSRRGGKTSK